MKPPDLTVSIIAWVVTGFPQPVSPPEVESNVLPKFQPRNISLTISFGVKPRKTDPPATAPPRLVTPPELETPPELDTPPVLVVPPEIDAPPEFDTPPALEAPPVVPAPLEVVAPPVFVVPPELVTPAELVVPPGLVAPPGLVVPPGLMVPPGLVVPPETVVPPVEVSPPVIVAPPVVVEELAAVVAPDVEPPVCVGVVTLPAAGVPPVGVELFCPLPELPHAGNRIPKLMAHRSDAKRRLLPPWLVCSRCMRFSL